MRRIVILVLVLAVGAALLWHFEGQRRRSGTRRSDVRFVDRRASEIDVAPDPPPEIVPEVDPETGTGEDPAAGPDGVGSGDQRADDSTGDEPANRRRPGERALLAGDLTYKRPPQTDTEPRIVVIADDMRALDEAGTKYELMAFKVDTFIVDGSPQPLQPLRSQIMAKTAQVDLRADEYGMPMFGDELDAIMFDVVVEQRRGSPLAPLTLDAPRLQGRLAAEELRSLDDDLVTFRSRDMRGSGRGFVALAGSETLAFNRGADVFIELGEGRQVRIITTDGGALTIVDETPEDENGRDLEGEQLVRVRARDGVQVLFQSANSVGQSPTTVNAASIDVLLVIGDGDERARIRSARADGAVTIRQGRDVYRGDTARILFEGPSPSRVILEESPRLTYVLQDVDGGELKLEVTGQGPVTGYLLPAQDPADPEDPADPGNEGEPVEEPARLRFVFVGPGLIEDRARGLTVRFENEARGQGVEDQSAATVLVSGDVRVDTLDGTLHSESILATFKADEDLRFVSEGPTRILSRAGAAGDQYRLLAGGGLSAHLVNGMWFIDRADDFHAEASGPDPHRVDAATVTNVDLAARTLSAQGDIRYQSLWGQVTADALTRSEQSIQLSGSVETPVVLELAPDGAALVAESEQITGVRTGFVRAVTLHLQENSFRAEGRVTAQFETADGVWGFDADTLAVQRFVLVESPGVDAEPVPGALQLEPADLLRIEADFVREARFDGFGGRVVFEAKRIIVEGVVLDPDRGSGSSGDSSARMDPDQEVTVQAFGDVNVLLESLGIAPDPVIARWILKSNTAHLVRSPRELGGAGGSPINLTASQVAVCVYEAQGRRVELSADEVEIDATLGVVNDTTSEGRPAGAEDVGAQGSSIVAKGSVDVSYTNGPSDPTLRGRGDVLVLLDGERGRLAAAKGKRVRVTGRLPGDKVPYTLTAKTVWFTEEELRADTPTIRLSRTLALTQVGGMMVNELSALSLVATQESMTLTGEGQKVIGIGVNSAGGVVRLKWDELTISMEDLKGPAKTIGPFEPVARQQEDEGADDRVNDGASDRASDRDDDRDDDRQDPGLGSFGVRPDLDFGDGRKLRGERGGWNDERLWLEGNPAHLEANGTSIDTEFFEILFEDYLIFAGRGAIRGPGKSPGESWNFEFSGIESRVVGEDVLVTISAPRVEWGAESARADYIAFFMDRARWKAKGDSIRLTTPMPETFPGDGKMSAARDRPNFLAEMLFELQSEEFGEYLRAVYMEGGIEISRADKRAVYGSKLYIDLQRGTAWIEDVEIVYPLTTSGRQVPLRIRTDRLETDEAGRLVAEGATLTTCDHDDPHFVVRTGMFALEPRNDGRWRFSAKGNRLKFQGGFAMPLPSIGNLVLDEDFGFEGFENEAGEVTPLRDIGVGQTARFGATLGAAFRFDIGKVGTWIAERLGMDSEKLRGKWDADARYLWDRGPLLGLGLQIREHEPGDDPDEDFRVDTFIGGVPDEGEDRGTVRVPVDERDTLRVFGYVRSRYPIVRGEWVDVAFASQTDAGIQAEFYENQYLNFEQRDTFVRWRKSLGADYLTAGVQKRVDSFRSQKEELPSFSAYRGERRVGTFTGLPVLWGGDFEAAYLKRSEGDPRSDLFSDLPGGADLGIGSGEAARADTTQRVSIPIRTNIASVRATPFAEFRGTAWSDSLDGTEDPMRGALQTGLELSTTLHKVTDNGYLHAIAPRISARTDVWYDQTGGSLIPFDRTEEPIDGTVYEAGVRMLWQRPATFENLDIDLRTILRQSRENDLEDASEFATLAEYVTQYGSGGGMVGLRHDARYDMESTQTVYSRSTLAVRPNSAFLFEVGYSQARAITRDELYENIGVRTRWTVDPKWEIEAGYTFSLQEDRQLLSDLILRRFSHDFVLDIGFQDRAGEGGITFGFRFSPLLGWSRDRLGMLDR